jgi:hypothetical protein
MATDYFLLIPQAILAHEFGRFTPIFTDRQHDFRQGMINIRHHVLDPSVPRMRWASKAAR